MHAGSTASYSSEWVRRTAGSGTASGSESITSEGCSARISRGVGQWLSSCSHRPSTAERSPTIEEERRAAERARRANAPIASSAPGGTTGTRFAPDQHTATSSPSRSKPHNVPPARRRPTSAAVATRAAASTESTGTWAHTRSASPTSASVRTRPPTDRPLRSGARHRPILGLCTTRAPDAGPSGTDFAGSGHRDDGGPALDRFHLRGQSHGLLDEHLDDLGLGDGLDDLSLDEDLALAVAGRDAEV